MLRQYSLKSVLITDVDLMVLHTPLRNEFLCQLFRELNSTANPAYLPRKWAKWAKLAVLFSLIFSSLADSSKTAPRILIFSIAMGADYSFEVKNIEIWVPAFFKHSSVATMCNLRSMIFMWG